ncbi:MAG: hypothetical protein RSG95_01310 [Bacilli bacterium]
MCQKIKGIIRIIVVSIFCAVVTFFFIKIESHNFVYLPFVIVGYTLLLGTFFELINKPKLQKIFYKISKYVVMFYIIMILIFWCYELIVEKNYMWLLFSIPFWIAIAFIIKPKHTKDKKKTIEEIQQLSVKSGRLLSIIMVVVFFLLGLAILIYGLITSYNINNETKYYKKTKAYYDSYNIYNGNKDGKTYSITYVYEINKVKYYIETDYGINNIPKEGSYRVVKYDANNPANANFLEKIGMNSFVFFGIFFMVVTIPLMTIIINNTGFFERFDYDITMIVSSGSIFILGICIILFVYESAGSLYETLMVLKGTIIIPIMFIIIGGYQLINNLFFNKEINDKVKKNKSKNVQIQ